MLDIFNPGGSATAKFCLWDKIEIEVILLYQQRSPSVPKARFRQAKSVLGACRPFYPIKTIESIISMKLGAYPELCYPFSI